MEKSLKMKCNKNKIIFLKFGILPEDEEKKYEEHIKSCQNCRIYSKEIEYFLLHLKEHFRTRPECVSTSELLEYIFYKEKFDKGRLDALTKHLEECPYCRDELEFLKQLQKSEEEVVESGLEISNASEIPEKFRKQLLRLKNYKIKEDLEEILQNKLYELSSQIDILIAISFINTEDDYTFCLLLLCGIIHLRM